MRKARVQPVLFFLISLLLYCTSGVLYAQNFVLTIVNSDRFESLEKERYLLSGNVHLLIQEEDKSEEIHLYSDRLLIDIERKSITALGSVRTEGLQELSGEVITLLYDEGDIVASMADLVTITEDLNDDPITLHTLGTKITILPGSSMITYQNAQIGTRAVDPLSSIRAKQLSVLNDGDIIAQGATLSIGRVPLFWAPFLFIPGSRMIANPAIGFISDRGMFVNTTWEIFGRYPQFKSDEKRTLTKLLSSKEEEGKIRSWPIYQKEEELSSFNRWAKESSSYLALFGDAYQNTGLSMGYDTHIKLFNNTITLDSLSSFALDPNGGEELTASFDVRRVRSWSVNSLEFKKGSNSLKVTLPYYSDPSVEGLYTSRLHHFRLDSLFAQEQEFPSIGSDRPSYTSALTGNLTIPTKFLGSYLSTLTISNLAVQGTYRWQKRDRLYAYRLNEVVEPKFTVKASGTLLDFKGKTKEKKPFEQTSSSNSSSSLLPELYRPKESLPSGPFTKRGERALKLSYTLSEEFSRTYDQRTADEITLYSLTKGNILLSVIPDNRIVTSSFELLPQLTISDDPKKAVNYNQVFQLHANTIVKVPALGLSYTLRQRLFRQEERQAGTYPKEIIIDHFSFDSSAVTTHQAGYDQSYKLGLFTINPSLTVVLWPLTQQLTPKLSFTYRGFTLNGSLVFKEDSSTKTFKKDLLNIGLGYSDSIVKTTTSYGYAFSKPNEPSKLTHSLSLSFFDKALVFDESFEYYPIKGGDEHVITNAKMSVKIPALAVTYYSSGMLSALKSERLVTALNLAEKEWRFYRKRIALSLGLNASFDYDFEDPYSSSLTLSLKSKFQIAEFLDLSISFASSNTGFYHYRDEGGTFSWALLGEDLLRSFDLFGGGVHNTQFNLSAIDIELIHYLEDWTLNCKYTGSVVLSNNQYHWVPKVSIYLAWNTIPDLDIEEKWTRTETVWARSL